MLRPLWLASLDRGYTTLEGIGLLVGTVRWRQLDRPRRWLTAWIGIAFLASMLEPVSKALYQNTVIVAQFWYPWSGAFALWTLAALPQSTKSRDIIRCLAIVYIALWGILLGWLEFPGEYARSIGALHAMTILVVAAVMLIRRSALARHHLERDFGFLLTAGLVVFAAPTGFTALMGRRLAFTDPTSLMAYLGARLVISSCGLLLLIAALLVGVKRRNPVPVTVPLTE